MVQYVVQVSHAVSYSIVCARAGTQAYTISAECMLSTSYVGAGKEQIDVGFRHIPKEGERHVLRVEVWPRLRRMPKHEEHVL